MGPETHRQKSGAGVRRAMGQTEAGEGTEDARDGCRVGRDGLEGKEGLLHRLRPLVAWTGSPCS